MNGPSPTFEAVLFDMDGVLLDSFHVWFGVLNDVAAKLGHPPIDAAQLERAFGQGIERDARDFYGGVDVDTLRRAYDDALPAHVHGVRGHPEAAGVLAALSAAGVGTAVVTNTPPSLTASMLDCAGLAGTTDVVSAASPEVRGKPHPDLVFHALEALAVPADGALLVGDTDYDERAAAAADVTYLRYEMRAGTSLRAALRAALGAGTTAAGRPWASVLE